MLVGNLVRVGYAFISCQMKRNKTTIPRLPNDKLLFESQFKDTFYKDIILQYLRYTFGAGHSTLL